MPRTIPYAHWGRRVWRALLGIFYPRLCPACGEALQASEEALCLRCSLGLVVYREPAWHAEERLYASPIFGQLHSLYAYQQDSPVQALIRSYKYRHNYPLASFFVERALHTLPLDAKCYDLILAIPLTQKRLGERGYNQALLVARELGLRLGIPASDRHLIRPKHKRQHAQLGGLARRLESKDLFAPNPKLSYAWEGKRILVVDDVLTTGATLISYLRVLEQLGVARADVFTLCVTI